MTHRSLTPVAAFALASALACASDPSEVTTDESDLSAPLGSVQGASSNWGSATTCKTLPAPIATLVDPVVVVSLDGLTLHLWDRQGTFDKVYPVGPGTISGDVSLTPTGNFTTGPADAVGQSDNPNVVGGSPWAWWYRCKIWWTDPDTNQLSPVYAGLPLIRLNGPPTLAYAIHGPIDDYPEPSGGDLRRAYVSHGCVRMQAEDILEVFVLLRGHGNVPVTIQRQIERDSNSNAVDIPQRWIGSECHSDGDCNFAGGVCHENAYGPSFCTEACSGSCPDMPTEIVTACVPDGAGAGMCVRQASALNNDCRPYEGFKPALGTARFGSSKAVDACKPGSIGFIGDSCLSNADCTNGRTCELDTQSGPGFCTSKCVVSNNCAGDYGEHTNCVADRCVLACTIQDDCGAAVATTCEKVGTATSCLP